MKNLIALMLLLLLQSLVYGQNDRIQVSLQTTEGEIVLALYNETPLHRDNFIRKVRTGTYNGRIFNRVIQGFVIQCGEEQDEDIIPAEIFYPQFFHRRGILAMGRCTADPAHELKSADEQFYIAWGCMNDEKRLDRADSLMNAWSYGRCRMNAEMREYYRSNLGIPSLDGSYTIFGEVVKGLDIVERIQSARTDSNDRPVRDIAISRAEVIYPASHADSAVVIVYYDSAIGTRALDKVIRRNCCEVLYRYKNFNAYAIKIPDEAVRRKIEGTKGVLSVQDDRGLNIDNH